MRRKYIPNGRGGYNRAIVAFNDFTRDFDNRRMSGSVTPYDARIPEDFQPYAQSELVRAKLVIYDGVWMVAIKDTREP